MSSDRLRHRVDGHLEFLWEVGKATEVRNPVSSVPLSTNGNGRRYEEVGS